MVTVNFGFQANGTGGDTLTDYTLQRRVEGGAWTTLATVSATTTSYTDASALPATQYGYRLAVSNGVGLSAFSPETVVQTAAATQMWTGLPRLSVDGPRIVTPDGQSVVLRGANTMRAEWWAADVAKEESLIGYLAGVWGGNVVMRGYASDPVNAANPGYLAILDRLVAKAKSSNCYIVLAPRSFVQNGPQYVGVPPTSVIDSLAALAERYKGEAHVMYAAQVETNGLSPYPGTWAQVKPYYTACVDAVHAAAAPHKPITMTSGLAYGRGINGAVVDPILRPNVVYKTHVYQPTADNEKWFGKAVSAGLPVFVGEFGWNEQGMTLTDTKNLLAYCDQHGLSWASWLMDAEGAFSNNLVMSNTAPHGVSTGYGELVLNRVAATASVPPPRVP